jgi:SAM-dependent methyltransferase
MSQLRLQVAESEQQVMWRVSEGPEQYTLLLGQAIEHFLDEMRDIERRIMNGSDDHDRIFTEVSDQIDAVLGVCARFEQEVADEAVIKMTRSYFRKRTHALLTKSYAINRCRTWPQGHQGDFLTLETAYRDAPLSDGLGYYLDKYILNLPLGHGVRGRIERLAELLREELSVRKAPKVLDVACGSCRELQDILPEIRSSGAQFTCIDRDNDALNFAMDRLSHAQLHPDQLVFTSYNALRLFDHEIAHAEFGSRDIIYSVGFFDYLPDDFLAKLLNALYGLLNQGGKLIMAFKDADRYPSQAYHWLLDWDGFRQRRTPDFERLLNEAQIPADALTTARDRSGTIVFYTALRA